jgi:germination protein M
MRFQHLLTPRSDSEVSLRKVILLSCLILSLLVSGCQRKQEEPQAVGGRVEATTAYRTYFGDPPTVPEGICFAVAGFYPLLNSPDKVMPVPHFTFALTDRPQLVMEQVMLGGEPLGMETAFVNPFPVGTHLRDLRVSDGVAIVDFSRDILEVPVELQPGLLASTAHTLVQFAEIERVLITAEGQPLPFAPTQEPMLADRAVVVEPGPPTLLQAFLHEDDDAIPGEMLVFFDRPVRLVSFSLEYPQGEPVKGDYFTSVFDMAVVIHPEDPNITQVGDEVFVSWQIVDGRGREGRGEGFWPLGHLYHD